MKSSKSLVLFVILFMTPLGQMCIDVYAPSFPAIATYFNTSNGSVQLTVAIFLFGYGVGQLLYGPISDSIGRRLPLICGMLLFVGGSVLAVIAPSMWVLFLARLLQGLGITSTSVMFKTIATDSFDGKALAKVFSYASIMWGMGPIVAPAIGGYIQHYFGWRYNFVFLLVFGILVLLSVIFFLEETHKKPTMFNFSVMRSRIKTLYTHKIFYGGVLMIAMNYLMLLVFNIMAPFLVQDVLHKTAINYGHIALFIGLFYFIGAVLCRFLLDHFSERLIVMTAIVIAMLAGAVMLLAALYRPLSVSNILVPTIIIVFSSALIFPVVMKHYMSTFSAFSGAASAWLGVTVQVFSTGMTFFISRLHTNNAIPMASIYVGMTVVSLLAYLLLMCKNNRVHSLTR